MQVQTPLEYADFLFDALKRQLDAQKVQIDEIRDAVADISSGSIPTVAYADLRYASDGMVSASMCFVSDGLKQGESSPGTGCPVYYNPDTDKWHRLSDDTEVAT